jgi:glycyl-tRNA synthetase
MVQLHENIVGIDAAIFMHPTTWKASGHVDAFNDPMIDNKDSKKRYRVDTLIEEYLSKLEARMEKEISKARERYGKDFDETLFVNTHPRVVEYRKKIDEINGRLNQCMENNDMAGLKQLILDLEIVCPVSGTRNWTDVRQFHLMFSTQVGSVSEEAATVYLRPETAQGIFVNFLNVYKTARMKIPFGIAQTGKAFRNEIVARQFIFRMREFEQMEMQFFVRPGTESHWYEYWKQQRMKWHRALGFADHQLRFHDHIRLAHYARAACDIEFEFPFGYKELEGIHSRTDYDLKNHEEYSGKKLRYFDPDLNETYIPYVIETSAGLDRQVLAILSKAYTEEKLEDGTERVVLRLAPSLAPVKCAVLPLVNKDHLPEKARLIMDQIKLELECLFDSKDSIGRRYRRQDAIGTPYCITIDHQTLEDDTVTIRDRDTMLQERIPVGEVCSMVKEKVSLKNLLKAIV